VTAAAHAIWAAIQQVPDDVEQYSDPTRLLELPFPFPGAKTPTDRFDLHTCPPDIFTFVYMGRERFQHILRELPAPPVYVKAAIAATYAASATTAASTASAAAGSSAIAGAYLSPPPMKTDFFPPIPANAVSKSYEMFLYGTIGWGKHSLTGITGRLYVRQCCSLMMHRSSLLACSCWRL
jgi:hypothetical protein